MSESEGSFSKGRLEAFSDGVMAVIITIMVLELKAPETDDLADLVKLWPSFSIYFVSFTFVAIYWINHHSILVQARHATATLIWANSLLLFFLSLVPFATAYVGATRLAPLPTVLYGALQFLCGVAFTLTFRVIVAQRQDDAEYQKMANARYVQNYIALATYAGATALAAFWPAAATILFLAVAIAYVIPGLFAEARQRRERLG